MIRSISTKVYIDFENEWDKKINKVKKGMHGSIRANEQIHYMYSKVYAIAAKLNSDEVHWDDISLDNTYELNAKKDFFQFGEDVKAKLEVNEQDRTWKRYNTILNKLRKYRGNQRLEFTDITVTFLTNYETYLTSIGNATNTVHTNLKTIRAILYEAIKQGHMPQELNPFFTFKLKKQKTEKIRPREDQLQKIMELKPELESVKLAKDMFLFSLYCAGIRAGDLLQLTPRNIHNKVLRYQMDKTDYNRVITLVPAALAIYEKYSHTKPDEPIFPLLTKQDLIAPKKKLFSRISSCNSILNKNLKKIAVATEIDIPLTMHMARHGFSELARKKGISIYDISKALGHSSIAITENYLESFDEDAMEGTMNEIFGV